eukprot:CAMPEP_0174854618 /NCGR_PEP_ID=MMETSP1114-20130205/31857_1 /TAXON_ID=312471 /ORGANISM="Neobodo designis, Strain CCAP 1951/1" /LENGTH=144 /DNA_ID=CAMNT_0016089329 /DNA_START=411 /DNA_END=846 /DNA_ORIENTATION=-
MASSVAARHLAEPLRAQTCRRRSVIRLERGVASAARAKRWRVDRRLWGGLHRTERAPAGREAAAAPVSPGGCRRGGSDGAAAAVLCDDVINGEYRRARKRQVWAGDERIDGWATESLAVVDRDGVRSREAARPSGTLLEPEGRA